MFLKFIILLPFALISFFIKLIIFNRSFNITRKIAKIMPPKISHTDNDHSRFVYAFLSQYNKILKSDLQLINF